MKDLSYDLSAHILEHANGQYSEFVLCLKSNFVEGEHWLSRNGSRKLRLYSYMYVQIMRVWTCASTTGR
jgi:hypothetical protein